MRWDLIASFPTKTVEHYHSYIGFTLMVNWCLWFFFNAFSNHIYTYLPDLSPRTYYSNAFHQMGYYTWGMFKEAVNPHRPTPRNKFNPLQKTMYQVVMLVIVPYQFLTGMMLYDKKTWLPWIKAMGGFKDVMFAHNTIFWFFVCFLVMHIILASLGRKPSSHFKEMITGYEDE